MTKPEPDDRSLIPSHLPGTAPPWWQRAVRLIGPVVALSLIALAANVLQGITREIGWSDIRMAVVNVPPMLIAKSMGLAVMGMITMALYDVVSARIAGIREIPARVAGMAGFCGYALSNMLGFHVILGGSVRYRFYAAAGLSPQQIAQILALSLGTIWFAVGTIFAVVMVIDPMALPLFGTMAPGLVQLIGAGIGLAIIGLVVWLWPGRPGIGFWGWHFPVPGGPGALLQISLGLADLALAAAALYVVMPADLLPPFPAFLLIFLTAFLAGTLSHAPGGLGVIEAAILIGLAAGNRPDAIAALMAFRLTYYLVPFVLAASLMTLVEARSGARAWAWIARPALIGAGLILVGLAIFVLARTLI